MRRLSSVRRQLTRTGVDSFLIVNPLNIRYLTAYAGGGALLVLKRSARLFVPRLNQEQALMEACDCQVLSDDEEPIVAAVKSGLPKSTGVLGYETELSYGRYIRLKKVCKGMRLKPVENLVEDMRMKKDGETDLMKRSARITSEVLKEVVPLIAPRVSELDIAAEIEYRFRKKGADGCAFPPIVASGPNSSLPHAGAGRRKIKKGDFLTIDLGGYYKGYASDMTRTFVVGKPSAKQRQVYNAVRKAQQSAIEGVKAGILCKQIDTVARGILDRQGFGKQFIHSLGHGIGLAVHEFPYLSQKSIHRLESGMVVTIEPGVYIPRWGGVRIEDMVLVEENHATVLTSYRRDLVEV